MADNWELIVQLFNILGKLSVNLVAFAVQWALVIAWIAWWFWGVNWKKTWVVLAGGAWLALVLLIIIVALVWSQLAPRDRTIFGAATIPNFWWQLGVLALVAGGTLLCGWLQGVLGVTPADIDFEPPAQPAAAGHVHH